MQAVAHAAGGDIIKLAAGTYSNISLQGVNIPKGITITSADPLHQAVLTDIKISKCSGLTLQGMNLTNTQNADLPFQVMNSSNIVMDNLNIAGSGNSVAAMNARLMIVRGSSNVQVTNSEFSYGWHGLSMLNNNQVTIENNYFHDLRTDGVRGGGNSNLSILANVFSSFHPQGADHPDAIQLWTSNTSQSSSNILIQENVISRGTGTPIQGIFMRDITGHLPFLNVTVSNNIVEGSRFNGIAVSGVKGGSVINNVVQAYTDYSSGIQMQGVTGVTFTGNQATKFFGGLQSVVGQSGNGLVGAASDAGLAMVTSWLKQHAGFVSDWLASDPTVLAKALHWGGGIPIPTPTPTPTPTPSSGARIQSAALFSVAAASDGLAIGEYPVQPDQLADSPAAHHAHGLSDDAQPNDTVDTATDSIPGADAGAVTLFAMIDDAGQLHIVDQAGNDVTDALDIVIDDDNDPDAVIDGGDAAPAPVSDHGDGAAQDVLVLTDQMTYGDGAHNVIAAVGGEVLLGTDAADVFNLAVTDIAAPARTVIKGFDQGVDHIILSDGRGSGDPAKISGLTFIDQSAFTGHAGEVRYFDGEKGVTVQADIDGDGVADLEFAVRNVHSLSVSDFIL